MKMFHIIAGEVKWNVNVFHIQSVPQMRKKAGGHFHKQMPQELPLKLEILLIHSVFSNSSLAEQ